MTTPTIQCPVPTAVELEHNETKKTELSSHASIAKAKARSWAETDRKTLARQGRFETIRHVLYWLLEHVGNWFVGYRR